MASKIANISAVDEGADGEYEAMLWGNVLFLSMRLPWTTSIVQ